jgi:hypothetical protein
MVSPALACTTAECVEDAKQDLMECVITCQEAYRVQKDVCRNINHDCADDCREEYEKCVIEPSGELALCKGDCNRDLEIGRAWCRANTKWGTEDRDKCIDLVQLRAFGCKDQCRENVQVPLTQCWKEFRGCIKTCSEPPTPPPPPPPPPPPN